MTSKYGIQQRNGEIYFPTDYRVINRSFYKKYYVIFYSENGTDFFFFLLLARTKRR